MKKISLLLFIFLLCLKPASADMMNYCGSGNNSSLPPFLSSSVSPLVMFVMGRDHKLYYEAYNDATDLDGDGFIDIGYKHDIDYYGYFDSYKCYTYTTSGTARFNPSGTTDDKYCGGTGEWSGNFLNWLTMSRMDVLRKVLYGGHRKTDGADETVLSSTYIPRDAHSWGKEYWGSDTRDLTPYDAPSNFTCDMPDAATPWNAASQILFVTYRDGVDKGCGTSHDNMISTFSPQDYTGHKFVTSINYSDTGQGNQISSHGNIMYVMKFRVPNSRWYHFSVDSDDGGELEVNNTIIASYYGCHGYTGNTNYNGSIYLQSGTDHTLIVRVRESAGDDGARVQYRIRNSANNGWSTDWKILSQTNMNTDSITFRAPNVPSTTQGQCSLKTNDFINTGEPFYGADVNTVSKRHLFCMTSDAVNADHLIKVARNQTKRKWEWASTERPVCSDSVVSPDEKRYVRVKVCDSSAGEETNCYDYGSGSKKPTGLLQRYGTGSGETICSKTNEKAASCVDGDGFLVKESPMYFGMITGSYEKNLSGGVLRKNITSMAEEINANGTFVTTVPTKGSIIRSLSTLQINDYDYGSDSYNSNCGWITDGPLEEGECKAWGNPIGEMYWEALRYLAGKGSATSGYTYSSSTDGGLSLPKPSWVDPYSNFPYCAKPNIIILSDVNPSYDDGVPASGTLEDYNKSELFSGMSQNEELSGNYFIGNNGILNDFMCSAKSLSSLGSALGLCPEEPTKKGTYNTAALAYYAKTKFTDNSDAHPVTDYLPNIDTHSVALASPLPEIVINVNSSSQVKIVPLGKSVGGSGISCGYSINNSTYGLILNGTGFCPSNGIVDFYAETISETSGRFRINFEDVEQGADHDMDAIARYDYVVNANGTVTISLTSEYAAGGINQAMGFIITGTSADGVYLPISDLADGSSNAAINGLPLTWSKTFTPGGTNASLLKDPLWYAAKYGGFNDSNGDGLPDLDAEWDEDGDSVPDNYHFITNPLELEQKLAEVFQDILKKVSSGTAVSIDKTKNNGMLLNHAVFYPNKDFGDSSASTTLSWIGQLFTYWFYSKDSYQSIIEDTDKNKILEMGEGKDKILEFYIDSSGTLQIDKYATTAYGGKGARTNYNTSLDDVAYLWEGGASLAQTPAASRIVYTNVDGSLVRFTQANADQFLGNFGNLAETCLGSAANLINYVLGVDTAGCRSRTYTDSDGNQVVYKLGDIINSSPVMINHPKKTGKPGYVMTYVGANDGMLHAFRAGRVMSAIGGMKLSDDTSVTTGANLGKEEWAFIPKNALPYLRYLADPDYCHLYYNDLTPHIIEEDGNNDGYIDRRILIGGMRLGGACGVSGGDSVNPPSDTCSDTSSADCVGLSSYYALDITDQNNPALLWEFSEPHLGFSFSGPAYIKKGGSRYIMFLSGPTDYAGSSAQRLSVFVLNLNSDFTLKSTGGIVKFTGESRSGFYNVSALAPYTNTFGGKLFSKGVDYGGDGDTDTVFFGVSQYKSSAWTGNVLGVSITSETPSEWTFNNVFDSSYGAAKPVTASVEHMSCFDMNYIYFGTGRWFYKTDESGSGSSDRNYLYGVRIDGCKDGDCDLSEAESDVCSDITGPNDKYAWKKALLGRGVDDLMERLIANPATTQYSNVVYFNTTMPNADICAAGGQHRIWSINCATGKNAPDYTCPGYSVTTVPSVVDPGAAPTIIDDYCAEHPDDKRCDPNYCLQHPDDPDCLEEIPDPEFSPEPGTGEPDPLEPDRTTRKGKLLFWIER
ncbi:hypothetical protein EP073_01210 [Geovibrio thiophilus]|uniref:PA14 domain-containing protein n=1 Tax=Geovibrio thiophilus TaxID=139438 RepID=A0A410JVJ7_9BACT|nr:hypothetical protein [Geovibrio thiophilus]QAR32068.1 hypothetical protein EP073_01210 [Geovibrio thiophilus]